MYDLFIFYVKLFVLISLNMDSEFNIVCKF